VAPNELSIITSPFVELHTLAAMSVTWLSASWQWAQTVTRLPAWCSIRRAARSRRVGSSRRVDDEECDYSEQ
jgi:hypothetical protein